MTQRAKANERAGARTGTRERLVEAAGQMFAARGFDGATAKEISERAGVNPAAVNYHFDGLDGLYEAVLLEAKARAGRSDDRPDPLDASIPLEELLRVAIALVVTALTSKAGSSWIVGLFSRELTQATPIGRRILGSTVAPRLARVRAKVGKYIGLDPDDPRVAIGCIALSAPLQLLLISDKDLLKAIHPSIDLSPNNAEFLIDHFHGLAMAGLNALKAEASFER